jgi:uncharacterized protein YggE
MRAVLRNPLAVALALMLSLAAASGARAQTAPMTQPSIAATGTGEASAPATVATIQLLVAVYWDGGMGPMMEIDPGMEVIDESVVVEGTPPAEGDGGIDPSGGWAAYAPGAMGPAPITAEELQPVLDALVAAGIEAGAITVLAPAGYSAFSGPTGPNAGQIRFELADPTVARLTELIGAAQSAAIGAGLSLEHAGVRYGGADCDALIQAARENAVANARANAEGMAAALDVELGELIQAGDSPDGPYYDTSGCQPGADAAGMGPYGDGTEPAFDPLRPAEVTVFRQVVLTYALGEAAA